MVIGRRLLMVMQAGGTAPADLRACAAWYVLLVCVNKWKCIQKSFDHDFGPGLHATVLVSSCWSVQASALSGSVASNEKIIVTLVSRMCYRLVKLHSKFQAEQQLLGSEFSPKAKHSSTQSSKTVRSVVLCPVVLLANRLLPSSIWSLCVLSPTGSISCSLCAESSLHVQCHTHQHVQGYDGSVDCNAAPASCMKRN